MVKRFRKAAYDHAEQSGAWVSCYRWSCHGIPEYHSLISDYLSNIYRCDSLRASLGALNHQYIWINTKMRRRWRGALSCLHHVTGFRAFSKPSAQLEYNNSFLYLGTLKHEPPPPSSLSPPSPSTSSLSVSFLPFFVLCNVQLTRLSSSRIPIYYLQ